jgi:hypothetical protein
MANTVNQNLGSIIGTAGTTVLSDQGGNLVRTVFLGTFVGSVEFYDARTAAGTAAGNNIFSIPLPTTNQYKSVELDYPFKKGLVAVATGTPVLGVIWSK